jgi:ubiquinol-cytochrome c reductase cytochrome b subunit
MLRPVFDWLDSRTGFRAGLSHLLDEPLPPGVGWWFVTGSILMFLLGVQLLTGVILTMFYVPAPDHAHESVRYIMDALPFGRLLRGLHFFGASFIVVAAIVHMLRVVLFGSYKKPREATWLTGVVLLLVIMGFALSGYLLPWDQKAYWATTVTINVARSGPFGEFVAGLMRGGPALGALTLLRWYSAHVFLLPACLIVFVVSHVYLMRRHGISGPVEPHSGPSLPFHPYQSARDTLAMAFVFAVLVGAAAMFPAPLDPVADPTDASYVPRPEWYFLSLFQLLKYFPGPLEPVATVGVPGLVVGWLFALPFIDRTSGRRLRDRPMVAAVFAVLGIGVATLTSLGFRDSPSHGTPAWTPLARAGSVFVRDARCAGCHRDGGGGGPIAELRPTHDPEWIRAHVRDPEILVPGSRMPPAGSMSAGQGYAVASYMRRLWNKAEPMPQVSPDEQTAALVIGRYCASCHMLDGEGASSAPDLTVVGRTKDPAWLKEWITDPSLVDPTASMPAFGEALTEAEMDALVAHLARRK